MERETLIISPYRLEYTTIESLAKYLSGILQCSIEYGGGTISGGKETRTLRNQSEGAFSEYVLKLGESSLSFYNEFIIISPPINENFDSMEDNFTDNYFADSEYLLEIITELRRLGAQVVYFIDKKTMPQNQIKPETTWSQIEEKLTGSTNFFAMDLYRKN